MGTQDPIKREEAMKRFVTVQGLAAVALLDDAKRMPPAGLTDEQLLGMCVSVHTMLVDEIYRLLHKACGIPTQQILDELVRGLRQ